MKTCSNCGKGFDDKLRFCPSCGREWSAAVPSQSAAARQTVGQHKDEEAASDPLMRDSAVMDSTIIGKQNKYEADNITIQNNITEDHSRVTVVCAVSGKHVYLDHSVVCPVCGKPVSLEYYVEEAKRCENCDNDAKEEFTSFVKSTLKEGALDANKKKALDDSARRLKIGNTVKEEIIRSVQNISVSKNVKLSSVQEVEMQNALQKLFSNKDQDMEQAFGSLSILHEHTANYSVAYWYYIALMANDPERFIKEYEAEVTDIYWQRYWGFVAYSLMDSPKASVALERLGKSFPEHEDDIRLAESIYYSILGYKSIDRKMLDTAAGSLENVRRDYLSLPLQEIYDTLKKDAEEGFQLKKNYSRKDVFYYCYIFQATNYVAYLMRVAEMVKQAEEEKAQASGGKPEDDKAFAGYETDIPKKKPGWKKWLLIGIGCVILIIIILFLIPAPESML